jgi:(R,R)-butanediol dehydrogenase / meso-butanediol dehydrogenase / diacetyl reductase
MKAAVLLGPGAIVVKDVPEPKAGKGEVVIRVHTCGICGGDLGFYVNGMGQGAEVQRILGHEFSGDVVEVGPDVEEWKDGDRVVVEPMLVCWNCYYCRRHEYSLCPSLGFTGIDIDGGFAEFVRVPAYQLHRLPDEVSYDEGAMVEPMAVGLHALWRSGLKLGDTTAVLGAGPIGLLVMEWAKLAGSSKVLATEVSTFRVAVAEKVADVVLNARDTDIVKEISGLTNGLGPDIVFECTGNSDAEVQAMALARRGGRVIVLGMPHKDATLSFALFLKEISVSGGFAYASLLGAGEFATCLEFLKSKKIDPFRVVPTTKVHLEDIVDKGFKRALLAEEGKVLVSLET